MLGLLARAARDAIVPSIRAILARHDVTPGLVVAIQTFGSYDDNLAAAPALAASMAGCSSTDQFSPSKGDFRMALRAFGTTTAAATTTGTVAADEERGLAAANVTISGASARTTDGTWVLMQGSFPVTLGIIALATSGGTRTLPPDVLPVGRYDAIQITITAVNLTLHDGTKIAITPAS